MWHYGNDLSDTNYWIDFAWNVVQIFLAHNEFIDPLTFYLVPFFPISWFYEQMSAKLVTLTQTSEELCIQCLVISANIPLMFRPERCYNHVNMLMLAFSSNPCCVVNTFAYNNLTSVH